MPDHELLAEYLDAIRLLTAAVHDDRRTKADMVRLSDRVLETQRVRRLGAGDALQFGRGALRLGCLPAPLRAPPCSCAAPSAWSILNLARLFASSTFFPFNPSAPPPQRLEAAMERREPSVRELFRTASRLAGTFVMRPASGPHGHAAAAALGGGPTAAGAAGAAGGAAGAGLPGMARAFSGGSGSGVPSRGRSMDILRDSRGGGGTWPEGSRPTTPDDLGV